MSDDAPAFSGGTSRIQPPLNRLVARRAEIDAARRALTGTRLLTFIGPGGVGKTRLALEVARRVHGDFDAGVYIVGLGDLNMHASIDDVEAAILSALGVNDQSSARAEERLVKFVQGRQLLIVLDNCEHVLDAVAAVARAILPEALRVKVLATSRQALGVAGETVRPVSPLSVPDGDVHLSPVDLATDGSVCLLLARAQEVNPDFTLTDANAKAVAQLCRMLEGIPLAIELAAAKLRSLTVAQIVAKFEHSMTSLGDSRPGPPGRHSSLRSIVEWSYDLCPDNAKILWRRLSVFPSAFDLDAAEEVCAFGALRREDVYDGIDRLVGQSILLAENDGEVMRYRVLAPVREFMSELAEREGETADLHRRHRDLMLNRAGHAVDHWCGPDQFDLVEQMSHDHSDYVSALQWCATTPGEGQAGLLLAARLRYHWLSGGYLADGRDRLDNMLAMATGATRHRGEALWVVTWLSLIQGDHSAAEGRLAELATLADELDDDILRIHVRHWSALLAMFTGQPEDAVPALEMARDAYRDANECSLELTASFMLAGALAYCGRPDAAIAEADHAVALSARTGELSFSAYALWAASVAYWTRGDLAEAEEAATSALRIQRRFADGFCVALSINVLAWVAWRRNRLQHAARLLAAAEHVWRTMGTSAGAFGRLQAETTEECKRELGARYHEDAVNAAASPADLAWAIELALGSRPGDRQADGDQIRGPLTSREFEVARLVEAGLSNREIAQRLVVSKRTVDGHVDRALTKLGFTSRTQIAAWMARRHSEPEPEPSATSR